MIVNNKNSHRIRKARFLSNKVELNPNILIITINVNRLHSPKIDQMGKIKKAQLICCFQKPPETKKKTKNRN